MINLNLTSSICYGLAVLTLCLAQQFSNGGVGEVECKNSLPVLDNNGTVVHFCPVGYGLLKEGCETELNEAKNNESEDSTSNTPGCFICQAGATYSDAEDSNGCLPCSKCHEGAEESGHCNTTHDTECHCPRGTFLNEGRCKPCDLCTHGQGVSKPCTDYQNTFCRKCPAGTYSGVLSATKDCALCTVCREDQVMLQECSSIQDTICIDKNSNKRHQFPPPSTDSRAILPEGGDIVSRYEPEVIPVYCTILVPIGLGLLAYFLLRWRLRKSSKTRNVTRDADCAVYRQDALLLGGVPIAALQKRAETMKLHVNHLNTKKRQDVVIALNVNRPDEKDWRALAKHLGYSLSKIASFGQLGSVSGQGPAHHLLTDWSLRPDATVHILSQSLAEIGRIDVLWMLQPTCEKMFPPYSGGEIV